MVSATHDYPEAHRTRGLKLITANPGVMGKAACARCGKREKRRGHLCWCCYRDTKKKQKPAPKQPARNAWIRQHAEPIGAKMKRAIAKRARQDWKRQVATAITESAMLSYRRMTLRTAWCGCQTAHGPGMRCGYPEQVRKAIPVDFEVAEQPQKLKEAA